MISKRGCLIEQGSTLFEFKSFVPACLTIDFLPSIKCRLAIKFTPAFDTAPLLVHLTLVIDKLFERERNENFVLILTKTAMTVNRMLLLDVLIALS